MVETAPPRSLLTVPGSSASRAHPLDPPDHRVDPEDLIQVVRLVNSLDGIAENPDGSKAASQYGATGL